MKTSFVIRLKKLPTATHQEKKVNIQNSKPIFYEPESVKKARETFMAYLAQHKPPNRLKGPLKLKITWLFGTTCKNKQGTWRDTKPDTDNLNKLPKDCMTDLGFWKDDAQVAHEIIEKIWWEYSALYVEIEELERKLR